MKATENLKENEMAKQLSATMEKLYAAELKRYSAQVGRLITTGELKSIRAKYERQTKPLISGDGWTVANV